MTTPIQNPNHFTPGDVYTVVRGDALEDLTSQGWEIHSTLEGTLVDTAAEDVPNPAFPGPEGSYGEIGRTISCFKSHVVQEVRFVMRKSADSVLAAKEAELEELMKQLTDVREALDTLQSGSATELTEADGKLLTEKTNHGHTIRDLEIAEGSVRNYREMTSKATGDAGKLKRQLAKVKRAIGADRMKEILEGKANGSAGVTA